jgi:hypothetical protein
MPAAPAPDADIANAGDISPIDSASAPQIFNSRRRPVEEADSSVFIALPSSVRRQDALRETKLLNPAVIVRFP